MSSLGADDITARFATLWRNFSNEANGKHIEMAFDEIPRILNAALLPAVIIFPGTGTYDYDQYGETIIGETRPYRCVVFVSSVMLGNEQTGKVGVEPYLAPARDYFAARPGLEDDTASAPQNVVGRSRLLNDEGYIVSEYPIGSDDSGWPILGLFHSTAFNFEVETTNKITYKD